MGKLVPGKGVLRDMRGCFVLSSWWCCNFHGGCHFRGGVIFVVHVVVVFMVVSFSWL